MFFKSFDPDKFEKELRNLSRSITKNERQLKVWGGRRVYYTKVLPMYVVSIYVAMLISAYLLGKLHDKRIAIMFGCSPFACGILLHVTKKLLDYMIARKQNRTQQLKEEYQEKLDYLKEKTNFDRTKELLVRYSGGEDIRDLEKEVNETKMKRQQMMKKIEDEQAETEKLMQNGEKRTPKYDGLLDMVLGQDEMSPDRRYALICKNCHQHNGLAPPGQLPEDVQYICPRCGVMNGTAKEVGKNGDKPDDKNDKDVKGDKDVKDVKGVKGVKGVKDVKDDKKDIKDDKKDVKGDKKDIKDDDEDKNDQSEAGQSNQSNQKQIQPSESK